MATYNTWISASYIYQDDGGSFSANHKADTVFDYFPDDAAVDDALYFTCSGNQTRNVKLYVGTSFAATSVTFVWEYYKSGGWNALSDITNGDALTLSGEQIVTYTVPTDWLKVAVNGVSFKWIRCRISTVNTPTEGGANSTQVVQVGDDTIHVTGGTEGSPVTMTNIYNDDISGGWGVLAKDGNSFTINAAITFGDGSTTTYFRSIDEYIQFRDANYRYAYLWGSDTTVQLGLYNASYGGYGVRGTTWFINYHENSVSGFRVKGGYPTLKAYGSSILRYGNTQYTFYNAGLYLVTVDSYFGSNIHVNLAVDIRNSTINSIIISTTPTTFTNSRVINRVTFRKGATLENVTAYNMYMWENHPNTSEVYLKDCSFTALTMNVAGGDRGVTVYIQYSFNLKVVDNNGDGIQGATVSFDGTETTLGDETTDSNGDITSQWITYRKRVKIISPSEDTDVYYANPMTVTITKSGYITKTIKYTMDQKRTEIEALENVVKWIKPENVDDIIWNLDNTNQSNKYLWTKV